MSKLFKSAPAGLNENDSAVWRHNNFQAEYGELQKEWYEKLVEEGMPRQQVLGNLNSRQSNIPRDYCAETEEMFRNARRFYWVGSFETRNEKRSRINRKIWKLFCEGMTERQIGEKLAVDNVVVHRKIKTLVLRMREAMGSGLLKATDDPPQQKDYYFTHYTVNAVNVRIIAGALRRNEEQLEGIVGDAFAELQYEEQLENAIAAFEDSKQKKAA